MSLRRFSQAPAGSILHYGVRVQPPGCAALRLTVSVDGVTDPQELTTLQIANLTPELTFGPITAGGSLLLELTMAFVEPGIVAVVPRLDEPGGDVKTRDRMVFSGQAGEEESADVSVRT